MLIIIPKKEPSFHSCLRVNFIVPSAVDTPRGRCNACDQNMFRAMHPCSSAMLVLAKHAAWEIAAGGGLRLYE